MDPTPYYGPYQWRASTVPVNAMTQTVLCEENYNRVCLYLGVTGVNAIGVSPRLTLANGQGILLSQNAVPWLIIRFSEDGPLVGQKWVGFSTGAAVVEVIEVIQDREVSEKWQLIPELQYAQYKQPPVFHPLGQQPGDNPLQFQADASCIQSAVDWRLRAPFRRPGGAGDGS